MSDLPGAPPFRFPWLGSGAMERSTLRLVGRLLLLALLANGGLGTLRGCQIRPWIRDRAKDYDASFDRVVIENGQARVEGDRLPRFDEGRQAILVDPEETIDLADLHASEYVVVRRDRVLIKRSFQPEQVLPLKDLESILGKGPTVIDGSTILAFDRRFGLLVGLLVALIVGLVGIVADVVTCPLYALPVAAVIYALRRAAVASFGRAYKLALATSAAPIVLGALVSLLGQHLPCCLSLMAWPTLMFLLALLALIPPRDDVAQGDTP